MLSQILIQTWLKWVPLGAAAQKSACINQKHALLTKSPNFPSFFFLLDGCLLLAPMHSVSIIIPFSRKIFTKKIYPFVLPDHIFFFILHPYLHTEIFRLIKSDVK